MRKLKHNMIERTIRETITELTWWLDHEQNDRHHRTRAELVTTRANEHLDEGLKARTYDGDGRGGSDLTGPERDGERRAQRPDVVGERITQLAGLLTLELESARALRSLAGMLLTSQHERDRAAASAIAVASRAPGAGHCNNCTTWVPGTRIDRLRSGRCRPCYEYQHDHHGNERPRELWDGGSPTATGDPRPA